MNSSELISSDVLSQMIDKTFEVMKNSYSPYSKFRVGSAVLTESNEIFVGTNVENASYGLAVCAERNAIFAAVAKGHRKFKAIVVSTDIQDEFKWMCGACCQVCLEFGKDWFAYSVKPNRDYEVHKLKEFLPFAFTPEDLLKYQNNLK